MRLGSMRSIRGSNQKRPSRLKWRSSRRGAFARELPRTAAAADRQSRFLRCCTPKVGPTLRGLRHYDVYLHSGRLSNNILSFNPHLLFFDKPGCISFIYITSYIPLLTKTSPGKTKNTCRSLYAPPSHLHQPRSEPPLIGPPLLTDEHDELAA